MFPLDRATVPDSAEALAIALSAGLGRALRLPNRPVVQALGAFPTLDQLVVDVSEAHLNPEFRPARPNREGRGRVSVAKLAAVGQPVRHAGAAVRFELAAHTAEFTFAEDDTGSLLFVPVTAKQANMHAHIQQADLEALLLVGARAAAERQGVSVERTEVTLTCLGEKTVRADWRVTASKRVVLARVRAVLRGRGTLTIDDALQARLSDLDCAGEGLAGELVEGMVREQLQAMEGRTIALAAFALGGLTARAVRLDCRDGLRVAAEFGGA